MSEGALIHPELHCCYLEPEADQSQDDLGTDLKPLVCSYQTLKLLGQKHML